MDALTNRFFMQGELCVCIKDTRGRVLYQNVACRRLCGERISLNCAKRGCMLRYVFDAHTPECDEGTQYFPNQKLHGKDYDILFINDRRYLTTLLYPLANRYRTETLCLSAFKLTTRERQVASLAMRGYSNARIARELRIAKGTLKKHLNNIYGKLPPGVLLR